MRSGKKKKRKRENNQQEWKGGKEKNFWAATSQESGWETDSHVKIQITHSPANHAVTREEKDERQWGRKEEQEKGRERERERGPA